MPQSNPAGVARRLRMSRLARHAVWLAAVAACAPARAEPSVPWMPDATARHRLELLVDEAGLDLPLTQWPLPSRAVEHELDALPGALPPALADARAKLKEALHAQDRSRLTLRLRGNDDSLTGFGDDATPGSGISVRSSTLMLPRLALQVGGRIDASPPPAEGATQFRLDDTALATEVLGLQLQAWSHRSWWGPGWQNSLVLGNNAPPFNGIGFQRSEAGTSGSRWWSWLGPWNFEFFVAQAEGGTRAMVVGNRLTARPWPLLEIGLTRTAQWGGDTHAQTVNSFLKMLAGIGVNATSPDLVAGDPANEMSGFDLRLRCPGGLRCATYAQIIGEDATQGVPSRFLGLYGIESWSADGAQRWFGEYVESLCGAVLEHHPLRPCAYRNYAYPEGYASAGRWMGAAVGPDSRVLTLGWMDTERGSSLRLHSGRIGSRIATFTPDPNDPQTSGRLLGVAARQDFRWGDASVTAELDWLRIHAADGDRTEARLGATLRYELDGTTQATGRTLSQALAIRDDRVTPLLIGAGLVFGSAPLDRPLDNYAKAHGSNPSARGMRKVGDTLPIAGFGLAGLSWLTQRGSPQGEVAFNALEAGLSALAIVEVSKLAIDRARPSAELGPASFGDEKRRADSSFPSGHSALAWALVTPYAEHYQQPWLYGAAALTSASRVMGRHHWVSDTVAGAVLGYWVGDAFYRRGSAGSSRPGSRLVIAPNAVVWSVPFE